jgi:hypothetical protein
VRTPSCLPSHRGILDRSGAPQARTTRFPVPRARGDRSHLSERPSSSQPRTQHLIWPRESIMSILWKLVLANRLPGHLVANQVNAKVDPYEGVPPSFAFVDIRRLSSTLGVSVRLLRRSLLAGSEHRQCCENFRYCRSCSSLGYHSVLFQRPSESICPVHKLPLETECRRCSVSVSGPRRNSLRLLDVDDFAQ